jgi:hypothetical protein
MNLYVPAYIAPKHVDFMEMICQQEILTPKLFLPLRFRGEKKNLTASRQNFTSFQTGGNRIVQPKWIARNAVLIIDLDKLDFGELFEVVGQNISNIVRWACRCARAR